MKAALLLEGVKAACRRFWPHLEMGERDDHAAISLAQAQQPSL